MKHKSTILFLISMLSIISIGLTIFLVNAIRGNYYFSKNWFSSKVSKQLIIEETYESIFEKVTVDAISSDIEVKPSKDQKIRVLVYGQKDQTSISTSDDELSITSKEQVCVGFCFQKEITKIEIYLPENDEYFIDIKNNYGDIEVGTFLSSNMMIEEDCGDVSVAGGNEIMIHNNYGDTKVDQASSLNIKEAAGDIKIGEVKDAIIKNNYGDIEIDVVSNYLDIEEDCGDVKIHQVYLSKNSKISNHLGNIKIGSTNEIFIQAETSLGDKKINQNYPKSDIQLIIENDCGDIKVNN